MYTSNLVCSNCSKSYPLKLSYCCPGCGGILTVDYNYEQMAKYDLKRIFGKPVEDLWQFKDLLPLKNEKNIVSLKEGGTPLLTLKNLNQKHSLKKIFAKDETRNPTGSFKDRPTSVGISKAIEFGAEMVTIASSGNAGASVAGYAAKAGLKSLVFVPEETPLNKINQALTYGADVVKVKGSYSNAYQLALAVSKKYNYANLTSTFLNPFTLEGDKTVAYELYYQLKGAVPDYIFVPIGAGPLLYGIFKGYREMKRFGFISKLPAMVGIQAEHCSPIVQAFDKGSLSVEAGQTGFTVASGIADPLIGYDDNGTITLRTIYESGGIAVSVSDDEIIDAVHELGSTEGLYVEPAAAASWAGYLKLLRANKIRHDDSAVLMFTGSGLKQPLAKNKSNNQLPVLEPILGEFERHYKKIMNGCHKDEVRGRNE